MLYLSVDSAQRTVGGSESVLSEAPTVSQPILGGRIAWLWRSDLRKSKLTGPAARRLPPTAVPPVLSPVGYPTPLLCCSINGLSCTISTNDKPDETHEVCCAKRYAHAAQWKGVATPFYPPVRTGRLIATHPSSLDTTISLNTSPSTTSSTMPQTQLDNLVYFPQTKSSSRSSSTKPSASKVSDSTATLVSPSAPKSQSKPGFFNAFLQKSKHPYTYTHDSTLTLDAKQQKVSSSRPSSSSTQDPDLVFGQLAAKYGQGVPSKSSK
ncbi:hypothetical protein EVG20_g741 [Dentipellis fragilis]|uniref:Uncharacterized protein n=1 Tax=Dentipellis fragilis TaxID=205917 RepID=A0A4Y9ZCF8_9AGAM|nr:hypothetical protein EVG20_g741 [Dentipellis fragilis]